MIDARKYSKTPCTQATPRAEREEAFPLQERGFFLEREETSLFGAHDPITLRQASDSLISFASERRGSAIKRRFRSRFGGVSAPGLAAIPLPVRRQNYSIGRYSIPSTLPSVPRLNQRGPIRAGISRVSETRGSSSSMN